jgi:hypothetical protein
LRERGWAEKNCTKRFLLPFFALRVSGLSAMAGSRIEVVVVDAKGERGIVSSGGRELTQQRCAHKLAISISVRTFPPRVLKACILMNTPVGAAERDPGLKVKRRREDVQTSCGWVGREMMRVDPAVPRQSPMSEAHDPKEP